MGEWSTGICGCGTCSDLCFCCFSTFCTPAAYGYNTALMRGVKNPCRIQHCGAALMQFMYLCAIQQYSVTSPQYLGLMSLWVCLTQTALVKNMVVVVGTHNGVYKKTEDLQECCICCDEPCCLSFWCMPCMLTRVQREVRNNPQKVYEYDDSKMTFKITNSMFDVNRNV
jgi:hypothetical protein